MARNTTDWTLPSKITTDWTTSSSSATDWVSHTGNTIYGSVGEATGLLLIYTYSTYRVINGSSSATDWTSER